MPSKSKNKGNVFERQIADDLSTIFGYNFERVPNSGAFVGGKNNVRYEHLSRSQQLIYDGDILVPDELEHLKIECKNYGDFAFHHLFSENKTLDSWIEQAHSDVKCWFLIFKITRRGVFVLTEQHIFDKLASCITSENHVKYKNNYIVSYDNFFNDAKQQIMILKNEYKMLRDTQLEFLFN